MRVALTSEKTLTSSKLMAEVKVKVGGVKNALNDLIKEVVVSARTHLSTSEPEEKSNCSQNKSSNAISSELSSNEINTSKDSESENSESENNPNKKVFDKSKLFSQMNDIFAKDTQVK